MNTNRKAYTIYRPERGPEIPEILKNVLKFTKCPEICPICPEILKI